MTAMSRGSVARLGHHARSSVEPSDAGYIWRCDCGALGYGLASTKDAIAEATRHVMDAATGEVTA